VARCLIIGCGCRGQALARELVARGHAVRIAAIEAAGAEPVVGDPDRVATVAPALEHVGVAVILLGSATGSPEALAALHGTRLDMLLLRMLDSTVRGIVYEAAGSVDASVLGAGAERVRSFCEGSMIPFALLDDSGLEWPAEAADAVERVLRGG
jgi:NAD(P)-dependent dehydrogenase (short-subunit alcohol dehydrogenase family)